jgi:hypothetical protein
MREELIEQYILEARDRHEWVSVTQVFLRPNSVLAFTGLCIFIFQQPRGLLSEFLLDPLEILNRSDSNI